MQRFVAALVVGEFWRDAADGAGDATAAVGC